MLERGGRRGSIRLGPHLPEVNVVVVVVVIVLTLIPVIVAQGLTPDTGVLKRR